MVGWVMGLEPTISKATTWRFNRLSYTHHGTALNEAAALMKLSNTWGTGHVGWGQLGNRYCCGSNARPFSASPTRSRAISSSPPASTPRS